MKEFSKIIWCIAILSGCTLKPVNDVPSTLKYDIVRAKNTLLMRGQQEIDIRKALHTLSEYEFPEIDTRLVAVEIGGDGRLHCMFKYISLKFVVIFDDGKYINSTDKVRSYGGFGNYKQSWKVPKILSHDQLRCKGDLELGMIW